MARTHGLRRHPLYKTWCEMRYRCEDPKKDNYRYYGGRGIKVCYRWLDFAAFVADMGERPEGMTLDRINPDGHYEPTNCRWATKETQANNTRANRTIVLDGQARTLSEWSRIWRVPMKTIWRRLSAGWEPADAIKRSVRPHRPYMRAEGRVG